MHNPGDIIAQKYQVLRLLGQGGMSNIYLCKAINAAADPTRTGGSAQWVLKEMTVAFRDPDDQERAVKLFQREAKILQQLHHHNLPRVIDLFVAGNQYYFVMEYVEGEDLGRILARHPGGFEERQVASWGVEIATVLYYLHCQKPPIIFRDVKPSNIMISQGTIKLIDFGIARHYDHFKKKDTMRIGSPGYAPPEQYSGQTDPRSDIYSLGVTLHQLLTGRDPSETQTPFKLPGVRTLNPRVSATMAAIIEKATEMDQARRYKTALEMKRALQAVPGPQQAPHPEPRPAVPAPARAAAPSSPFAPPVVSRPAPVAAAQTPPLQPVRQVAVPPRLGPPAVAASAPTAARPATPPAVKAVVGGAAPAAGPLPPPGRPNRSGGLGWLFRPKSAPSPPRQRRRFGWLRVAAILILLAAAGGWMHQSEIIALARQWLGRNAPIHNAAPGPTDPTHQALALLRKGRTVEAMDALDEVRARTPSDGLAAMAWNDGLAQLAAPSRTVTLQAVFPGGAEGEEWARGLALAQRDLNKRGGVQNKLVVLLPEEYGETAPASQLFAAAPDASYLAQAAASEGALAAIAYLPGTVAARAADAYSRAGIPLLLTSARPSSAAAVLFSTDLSSEALAKALAATALGEIRPARAAVVALAGATPDAASRVVAALDAKLPGTRSWNLDNQPHVPADLLKLKPDLVVLLGEPEAEARWIDVARAAGLGASFLAGPGLFVAPDTPLPEKPLRDLVGSARLFVVTPYTGEDLHATRFALDYDRVYGRDTLPGYWAAAACDALGDWARAMGDPSADWSARGVRQALARSALREQGTLTGVRFDGGASSWSLLRLRAGAWQSASAKHEPPRSSPASAGAR